MLVTLMAVQKVARFDPRTLLLFTTYVGVLLANFTLVALGAVSSAVGFLISVLAFNLSFTIWHECVHYTVTSRRRLCTLVGVVTTFFMIYPGYFSQRREHLLHHKYQGDPLRDPVYPRVQCSAWKFPLHLLWVTVANPQPPFAERHLSARERLGDALSCGIFALLAWRAIAAGLGWPLLVVWVLPRALMVPIHAFYVCYLPHSGRGAQLYETYRIALRNPLTRYLTLYHAFHGLHHVWPGIPWHRYRRTFLERRAELEAHGVDIVDGGHRAPG